MHHDALSKKQIVESQLRIVDSFGVLAMTNAMARNFERLAYSVKMKTDYSWRQPDGRNATLRSQAPHSRFTYLQDRGKLFRG